MELLKFLKFPIRHRHYDYGIWLVLEVYEKKLKFYGVGKNKIIKWATLPLNGISKYHKFTMPDFSSNIYSFSHIITNYSSWIFFSQAFFFWATRSLRCCNDILERPYLNKMYVDEKWGDADQCFLMKI